jgi:acyl carrier protein phosphodiesterase
MKEQNWLFYYRTRWGIQKSMGGLVRRAAYLTDSDTAFRLLEAHYQLLQVCYRQFWEDMKPFALDKLEELTSD